MLKTNERTNQADQSLKSNTASFSAEKLDCAVIINPLNEQNVKWSPEEPAAALSMTNG